MQRVRNIGPAVGGGFGKSVQIPNGFDEHHVVGIDRADGIIAAIDKIPLSAASGAHRFIKQIIASDGRIADITSGDLLPNLHGAILV